MSYLSSVLGGYELVKQCAWSIHGSRGVYIHDPPVSETVPGVCCSSEPHQVD